MIIDPEMVYASFSGSNSDNRGYTATYDNAGFMYIGGTSFGIGYPVTAGAYQSTFSGGPIDVVVSKYSADGSKFLFSTYIGGRGTEEPHSMVVDKNNQLLIFGSTGSSDFPTTNSAYDRTFNGGSSVTLNVLLTYDSGSDIYVTKLNAAGSALIGSTYIGGNQNDGFNDEFYISGLTFNYGDLFRGEIITDNGGNAYIATTTRSSNFPIIGGFQSNYGGGGHDGVVMKLNKNLSALVWSSFLGGSDDDAAYSMQFDSKNDIYISGGTSSANFPTSAGVLNKNYLGGIDGFITHISAGGNTIKASTYLGTSSYDQCYFVQLDNSNNVFVYGQSSGSYPIAPASVYANPGSGQFIHKMNNTLTSTIFSSVFGGGTGNIQLSPTAFLVSNCEDIYISGWGGKSNSNFRNYYYPNSTVFVSDPSNLPLTTDAFQSTTEGSDFYIAVFSKDMKSLKYATYLGGPNTIEHVDGGTSRFDKKGNIYQAICGGCGGLSDFPTTPGVLSVTNKSSQASQCNEIGVKLAASKLSAAISGNADSVACINDPIFFKNQSKGGITYLWKFGTGDSSTQFEPSYAYKNTGDYTVTLLATNPQGCPPIDTAFMNLHIYPPLSITLTNDTICPGKSVTISASGANNYSWYPSSTLNKSSGAQVIASPKTTTKYLVTSDSYCLVDTAAVTVNIYSLEHEISAADSACPNAEHMLFAKPGSSFQWTPAEYFSNPTAGQTTVALQQSKTVYVNFKTPNGCEVKDSVYVKIIPPPAFSVQKDSLICYGKSLALDLGVDGNYSYSWTPAEGLNDATIKKPLAKPDNSTMYKATVSNLCGSAVATYQVNVSRVQKKISPDSTICPGDTMRLWATGGVKYLWSPASSLNMENISNPKATPEKDTEYKVVITNKYNCADSGYTNVHIASKPHTAIDSVQVVEYGKDVQISSNYKDYIFWSPATDLSCTECPSPLVQLPEKDISYQYALFDRSGCYFKDSVHIYVIRKVYAPNAFTPNGDGKNDVFYFSSVSVNEDFELMIFNRWGELIFTSHDINDGWDGTYQGRSVQIDTYVWKVRYKRDHTATWKEEIGKVTLLR
ncbi:MAG: gliding motility-associated C-terminal domain-containing protein [Bacteroidetes bacterium]|nr:gliding motility-associated C-terminal domain-containing protein [Bacteroidota bacterium]